MFSRSTFPLKSQLDCWNRSKFLSKNLIFLKSLKQPSGGNSVKISDCRAISVFDTMPGCRAFSYSAEKGNKLIIHNLTFLTGFKVKRNYLENCCFD